MTTAIKGIAFVNVRREAAAKQLSVADMAELLGMPVDTLSRKLSQKNSK